MLPLREFPRCILELVAGVQEEKTAGEEDATGGAQGSGEAKGKESG